MFVISYGQSVCLDVMALHYRIPILPTVHNPRFMFAMVTVFSDASAE